MKGDRHLFISNSEQSKGTGTFSYKQRTKSSLAIDFGLVDKGEKQGLQVVENYRPPKKSSTIRFSFMHPTV